MKRPFTALMKNEEESADANLNTMQSQTQTFLGESAGTFVSNYSNESNDNDGTASDSEDALSENSKKMRKKRNAYQKISDEIRMNLLDSVKNGETLKSAAKRHKINYSSAKSILHTYRKEGRILKKSAQERITKKKSGGSESIKTQSKSIKSSKKENVVADENNYSKTKTLETITKKIKVKAYVNDNNGEEVLPLSQANKNKANLPQSEYNQDHSMNGKIMPTVTVQKNDEVTNKLFGNNHDTNLEYNFIGGVNSRPASRKGSMNQFSIQMSYNDLNFPDFNQMLGDGYDFMNYRRLSQDFTSFNDMMHTLHPKTGQNEDHAHDSNTFFNAKNHHASEDHKHGKVENLLDCDDHGDNGGAPSRSFLDNQRMFRNTLRKASFLSFGSNAGFRKGSFDLY